MSKYETDANRKSPIRAKADSDCAAYFTHLNLAVKRVALERGTETPSAMRGRCLECFFDHARCLAKYQADPDEADHFLVALYNEGEEECVYHARISHGTVVVLAYSSRGRWVPALCEAACMPVPNTGGGD